MNVSLFAFAKKKNSTARPNPVDGTSFTVELKEETSAMNPVLIFDPASSGMPTPFVPSYFNYAHIIQWARYYFITDWKWLNGRWEASLVSDVLATYRSGIGALSEYVVRSSASYNGYISDIIYPTHTNISKTINNVAMNFNSTGCYAIGFISNDSGATQGAVTYYLVSAAQMGNIKSYLMSDTFLTDNGLMSLTEMSSSLLKTLYNPFQYITSCKYLPIPLPSFLSDEVIKFGWWTLPYSGKRMPTGGYVTNIVSGNIPTPAHPQSARGTYLNHAPYTERYIVNPVIGTIMLDSNKIDAGDVVNINISVDAVTGQATYTVLNSTQNIPLYQASMQLGVDVPIAQMGTDVVGVARTAIESTGNVIQRALQLDIAGAICSAGTGVLNTLEASVPIMQGSAVASNMSVFQFTCNSVNIFRNLVDEDFAHKGRPLCEVRTLSTIGGYIQCADVHAELSCLDTERVEIKNYLTDGFYYE